jgi:UDP-N-acetylglucosamine 2-epimerase (non-hydrolysing)
VGSTAVDTLIYIVSNKLQREEVLSELGVEPDSFILVTLHRRENLVDERLHLAISALVEIARAFPDFKVVFPVHPHTRKRLEELGLYRRLERDNVVLTKPVGYLEFVALLQAARAVITDSGGVQVEAFVLGKRIVTLRRTTEWIETVVLGYNQLVGLDDVGEVVKGVVAAVEGASLPVPDLTRSPLGDGRAGRRVAKILQTLLESGIEKWRGDVFKIPFLTKEGGDESLCFSANGFPAVENAFSCCISRKRIIPETLRAIIEVNWEEVDRGM